jgi:transposase
MGNFGDVSPLITGVTIVRYVRPLTDNQRHTLVDITTHDVIPRARVRAQSILLSAQGLQINDIATVYEVDRDTVATWIKKWEQAESESLYDKPRSGRPPKLTPEEKALARQYILEEPRCLKQVVERLHQKTAKRLSLSSLKRLAKKVRLRWKRVRKSLKSLRDPEEFAKCQRELEALQKQEDQGKIALYYFDESGFSLEPCIPYAWQETGTVIEVPARKSGRINVLGFMNRKNDLYAYMFEQTINTDVVIACVNAFCKTIKKKTIVVMDNSSIHKSEEFAEYLPKWKKKGLIIKYLLPYSPELNLIEILWRQMKYLWLPFAAYECMKALRKALENILKDFGSKYQITFA